MRLPCYAGSGVRFCGRSDVLVLVLFFLILGRFDLWPSSGVVLGCSLERSGSLLLLCLEATSDLLENLRFSI